MGTLLRFIFTPWGVILVGLVAIGAGGYMYWNGTHEVLPERSQLSTFSGVVTNVTKVTRTKRGVTTSVKYEVEVQQKGQPAVKLTFNEDRMSEALAASLNDETVTALLRDNSAQDVWELSAGRQVVIAYAKTRAEKEADLAWEVANAPYAGGGGLMAVIIGGLWFSRRRRDDA